VEPQVDVRGWPTDDAHAQAWDLVCRVCDGTARLSPGDTFVPQVRLFLAQHRHADD
jgi:hypothetical protein